jgi:hypothetical protein
VSLSPKKKSLAGFAILLAAGSLAALLGYIVPAPWTEPVAVIPIILALLVFLVANYLPKLQRESDRTGLGRGEFRAAPIAVAHAGILSEMSQAIGMVGCSRVYRLTTVPASAYWMPDSRHSRRTASGPESGESL